MKKKTFPKQQYAILHDGIQLSAQNLRETVSKNRVYANIRFAARENNTGNSRYLKFRIHKSQVFPIPNYTNSPGKTSPRDVRSALEFSKQLLASKEENKGRKKQDTLKGERKEKKRAALTSNDITWLSRLTRALNNLRVSSSRASHSERTRLVARVVHRCETVSQRRDAPLPVRTCAATCTRPK